MRAEIEAHYGGTSDGEAAPDLAARLRAALVAAGVDVERVTTADLAPFDELHVRGRPATLELAARLGLGPRSRVLDLGSGLGGPARTLAETYGCSVVGIDLTRAFCQAATALSEWVGLSERVRFVHGDATALPDELAGGFDVVTTIHAAMNVPDKPALHAAARRALRPGGLFGVYDVLQGEGGPVRYPVPWARDPALSFLATPDEMRASLRAAGFELLEEHDSTEAGALWFAERLARASAPAPLGLHALLGRDAGELVRNMTANLAERRVRTVAFVCRA